MIHITFNGITSKEMGVYWKSADRTLLPAKRVVRYEIPGKDGYYESQSDTYDNRAISGVISFMGAERDFPTLRAKARNVAQWLSGSGQLVFSDEPGLAYQAKVISGVPLEQLARAGSCSVTFDCQPFAQSTNYNQSTNLDSVLPATIEIKTNGTQKAPCIIRVVAKTNINNLAITVLSRR